MHAVELHPGRFTDAGREHPLALALAEYDRFERRASGLYAPDGRPIIAGGASFSDYLEGKVLEHITGKAELAKPTTWVSLTTAVPEDSKTGATITEAAYTTFARLKIEGTGWTVSGTSPTAIKNNAELTFAACTAGTSTIIGWAVLDSTTLGAGNVLAWGTATSTVISTTQTPPKVAANGLEITLD